MGTANLKQYRGSLEAADGPAHQTSINAVGTMFFVREILPAGEAVRVRLRAVELGERTGDSVELTMRQNDKVVLPNQYDRIELTDEDSDEDITVDCIFGDGDYVRPLPDLINIAIAGAGSKALDTIADVAMTNVAATQIVPANTNRICVIVSAPEANDVNLRIGDADVTATRGQPLAAGDTIAIYSEAALFGIEEAAGTTTISVLEVLKAAP